MVGRLTLNDFAPEAASLASKEYELSSLLKTVGDQNLINKSGETYRNPTFGVDQVVNVWVQQQAAFRQHMIQDIQQISQSVEEVRSPVNHIISEVFRRGVSWLPAFVVKCTSCGTEYANKPEGCTTKNCAFEGSSETLVEPDPDQYAKLKAFIKDCNVFDQSLEDVLREFWWDVNTLDDGFIYFAKEYKDYGDKVRSKVISVERLNPALIEYDLDKATGVPKAIHFVCYIHRDGSASENPDHCDSCGKKLVPAMFTYRYRGKEVYLLDSEVLHVSKFMPTRTYGWSPVLTLFDKVLTIIGMDKTLYRYFFERKMPASMILISTDDPDSLRAERERVEQEIRQNPEYIPMIAVSNESQRGKVDMIRLFHNLQEMDYLPVRQEIRERIAAMWGVTPAWQGAPEGFGGLSTQTQQLVVMSRVVEGDQRIFHEKVFPIILDMFGITDWTIELRTPEEKAEATQLQFVQQKVMVASQLLQDGYDVKLKSMDSGIMNLDFEISGKGMGPKEQMEMQQEQMEQMGGGEAGEGMGMSMEGMPDGMGDAQQGMTEQPVPQGQPGLGGASRSQTGQQDSGAPTLQPNIQNAFSSNYGNSKTMVKQIIDRGHIPDIKDVTTDMGKMWFKSSGSDYVATFNKGGDLMDIETAHFPKPPEDRAKNKHMNAIYEPDKLDLDGIDDL
jgi:hypothetical protein